MSTTFKTLLNNDVTTTRTLLHEAIPVTGAILNNTTYSDNNIKNYAHGIFQSVYDYPYLSSSANHIFDIAVGISPRSSLSSSSTVQNSKKINMYNQMAQVLVGHDITGGILQFDADGDMLAGGNKLKEVIFINLARLLTKDEIKKDSFGLQLGTGAYATQYTHIKTLGDHGAASDFRTNSPAGEYAPLYTSSTGITADTGLGLIYYQAGIAVISASVFDGIEFSGSAGSGSTIDTALTDDTIAYIANSLRHRFADLDFNNTTELNSTIYFCRANHNEFNYSSNPTYLSESKIRVKQNSVDTPVTYLTTVGLYSADNELLATAKVSEPLKKDPSSELTLRVRLDY